MAFLPKAAALLTALALTGCPAPPPPVAPPTPVPVPTPTPVPYVPNKRMETGRMFNGMQVRSTVETEWGSTATSERNDPASYALELSAKVRVPKPHRDMEALIKLNPQLPALLPALPALVEAAKVSPFFDELYRLKVANLQRNLVRLDSLLTRHNFYDTETVLELEHPPTKRRALLVQSEMDVDGDGSDSDRVPDVDASSSTFQPFTSYRWPKKTAQPNSFSISRETRLKAVTQELALPGLTAAKIAELKASQGALRGEILDLQKNSYLVAKLDPYIVMPGSMVGKGKVSPWSPMVGDYCVVIHGGTLFPAMVGDVGPAMKSGEGSLRLCQALNPRASSLSRPVDDLKVTYIVFPGSGDKPWDAPDLGKWRARCEALLNEMGGYAGDLHAWEDLVKKPEVPAVPVAPSAITPG